MSPILSVPEEMSRQESGNALLKIETAAGDKTTFVCQFNPDEFHISTEGKFEQIVRQGQDTPIIQYMGGSCSTLNLKLFFDTSTSYEIKTGNKEKPKKEQANDVSAYTNVLMSLVRIEGETRKPPFVTFCWGSLNFGGHVKHVDVKYTMFEKGGMPVRAEVSLNLVCNDLSQIGMKKLSCKESANKTKCIVMTSDNSLWDIAEKECGDASCWRDIAKENNIMNPLEVPQGTYLKVSG